MVQGSGRAGYGSLFAQVGDLVFVGLLQLVDGPEAFSVRHTESEWPTVSESIFFLLLRLLVELGLVLVKHPLVGLLVSGQKADVVHLRPSSLGEAQRRRRCSEDVSARRS